MQSNNTVILGEASESDGEEIPLGEDYPNSINTTSTTTINTATTNVRTNEDFHDIRKAHSNAYQGNSSNEDIAYDDPNKFRTYGKSMFGSSLFNSISTASTLAKLATYSPYNLLNPIKGTQTQDKNNPKNFINQLPPLHRNLYTKNQQLYACLAHVYRHPYEKANKDIQSINQRLVNVQKSIQGLDIEVLKIKREEKNLDIIVNLIA